MPWKLRNGSRYYYRSIREGGRVRTEYVGSGEAAGLIAEADRLEALERRREAEARRAEKAALEAEDLERSARFDAIGVVVGAALEAAGFRRRKRGRWRRPRMKTESTGVPPKPAPPVPIDQIRDVMARVEAGDKAAAGQLRELIALDPARMTELTGNLAVQVECARVARLAKINPVFGVSLPAKLDALKAELGGNAPGPVERLLVERVINCWLDSHEIELRAAHDSGGMTIAQAEHRERLRDRRHRRYLQALKTLATVRKLGPAVAIQVNIAEPGREKAPAPDRVDGPGAGVITA